MNDCPTPQRKASALQNLIQRMRFLQCVWERVALWTGWSVDNRPVFAPLQSRAYSSGTWQVTWVSEPGRYYSVQQSGDGGIHWTTVAVAVPAADSPAKTTSWIGPAMPYQEAFFRIVVLPVGFQICYNSEGIANVPGYDPATDPLASLS